MRPAPEGVAIARHVHDFPCPYAPAHLTSSDSVIGTTGQSRRIEAYEVMLLPKGCPSP